MVAGAPPRDYGGASAPPIYTRGVVRCGRWLSMAAGGCQKIFGRGSAAQGYTRPAGGGGSSSRILRWGGGPSDIYQGICSMWAGAAPWQRGDAKRSSGELRPPQKISGRGSADRDRKRSKNIEKDRTAKKDRCVYTSIFQGRIGKDRKISKKIEKDRDRPARQTRTQLRRKSDGPALLSPGPTLIFPGKCSPSLPPLYFWEGLRPLPLNSPGLTRLNLSGCDFEARVTVAFVEPNCRQVSTSRPTVTPSRSGGTELGKLGSLHSSYALVKH